MNTEKIRSRNRTPWTLISTVFVLIVLGWSQPSSAVVWIWDSTHQDWTATLSDGGPIDTTNPEDAVDPQIAVDGNGNTYVVYNQDEAAGTGVGRIYLSRHDSDGNVTIWDNDRRRWSSTLTDGDPIDTGIAGRSARNPRLAIDLDNNVYVVFTQSDGTRDRIYLSRYYDYSDANSMQIYSSSGWTTDFSTGSPIDADTGNPARMPRLAIDSDDQVYVTFYQGDGAQNHIYLCRYNNVDTRIWDDDIRNWTTTFANGDPIDTTLAQEADSPAIAIDSNNNVYIAYRQNDGAYFNTYLSRFSVVYGAQIWDTATASWTATFTSGDPVGLSGASGDTLPPDLTIDSNDQVYLAYAQEDAGINRLFLSRYNTAGVQIWSGTWKSDSFDTAVPIDAGNTNVKNPRIVADSADNLFVAFVQSIDGTDRILLSRWNGTNMQIWENTTPGWTTVFSDGEPVDADTDHSADAPEMAIDTVDRVYIAFHQSDGTASRVYLSRYDDTASPSSPVVEVWNQNIQNWTATFSDGDPIDAATGNNARYPQLAADASDEVFITFYQNDGAEDHIYLSAFTPSAAPPGPTNGSSSSGSGGSCFLSSLAPNGLFSH